MQTILYQGKPAEGGDWLALPVGMEDTYRKLGYAVRELVLREEAERVQRFSYNLGVEKAAVLAEEHNEATKAIAKLIRALKKNQPTVAA